MTETCSCSLVQHINTCCDHVSRLRDVFTDTLATQRPRTDKHGVMVNLTRGYLYILCPHHHTGPAVFWNSVLTPPLPSVTYQNTSSVSEHGIWMRCMWESLCQTLHFGLGKENGNQSIETNGLHLFDFYEDFAFNLHPQTVCSYKHKLFVKADWMMNITFFISIFFANCCFW